MNTEGFITLFLILCIGIWAVSTDQKRVDGNIRTIGYILLAVVAFFLFIGVIGFSATPPEAPAPASSFAPPTPIPDSENQAIEQQEKTKQLSVCLAAVNQKQNAAVLYWTGDYNSKNCITETNTSAALACANAVMEQVTKAKAVATSDRDDCYSMYQ